MIKALWSGVAGIRAFEKKADVTAHNVANVNTDGFKKSRAVMVEDRTGAPRVTVDRVELSGYAVVEETGDGRTERELSNVDLAEEMVNLTVARRGHQANLKTVQAADDMLESLLDIKV